MYLIYRALQLIGMAWGGKQCVHSAPKFYSCFCGVVVRVVDSHSAFRGSRLGSENP